MNRVTLMGRLGTDPELRYTQGGQPVANFNLATSEKYKDKAGEWVEKTEWHKCVVWGPRAETIEKHVRKGSQLLIEGSIQTRAWEDKDKNKRYTTEINVKDFEFCGGKSESTYKDDAAGQLASNDSFEDSEIPF